MTLCALSLPRADRDRRFPRESWSSLSSLLFSLSSLVVLSVSRCWLVRRGRRSLRGAGPTRLSVLHWTRFASSLFSLRGCLLLCIGEQLSSWERQERGWLWVNIKREFAFEDCRTEDLKRRYFKVASSVPGPPYGWKTLRLFLGSMQT